mgnify:CR=1 FL=1
MALVPFPAKGTQALSSPEPDWDDDLEPGDGGKMSFLDHLDELRRRIIYSVLAVFLGFLVAFFFVEGIFDFIFRPMQALLADGQRMIYTEPTEGFIVRIKLAAMAGLLAASPVVASQVWLFIAPGPSFGPFPTHARLCFTAAPPDVVARGVDILVDEPLPTLLIDTARLELILMNLVSNAVKYSDPAKRRRVVSVESASCTEQGFTCIAVRDNGLGIPAEQRRAIFGRFIRAHAERDSELGVRGSGLGLAIAAECAEAVGGAIRVESEPGEGTTFFVDIPCAPPPRRAD